MIKGFFIALFVVWSGASSAFVPPSSFQSSLIETEEALLKQNLSKKAGNARSAVRKELLDIILNDNKGRLIEDFNITPYFLPATKFWFSIYSQYTSHQVVIHDKENLDLVYSVMDFSPLHDSNINMFAKSKLQADLALERAVAVKKILRSLSSSKGELNIEEAAVLKSVKNAGIEIPKSPTARRNLFKNLVTTVRTQTGQRDMVYSGVLRSLPYLPFLERQFNNFGLPSELLAIAFVESSFNLEAESYAGASGVWQFMPLTSSYFMPARNNRIDYRNNPVISSLAAMHLLKQNKMILKRWDLAVPAYNFGTSHLVKAKRKYKDKATLEHILQNYEHNDVGFASKNYYAEFLAMARVLAYREVIFPLDGFKSKELKVDSGKLAVYVTKCRLRPKTFFSLLKKNSPRIERLNAHFLKSSATFRPKQIVVSDRPLTSRKYRKLSDSELKKSYPKNYYKYASNLKCGK